MEPSDADRPASGRPGNDRPALSRLAVSTLGAPGRSLEEVLRVARTAGARSLELRAGPGQPADPALGSTELDRRRALIEEDGMCALSIASYLRVAAEEDEAEFIADLTEHLRMAARLGTSYLRIFPGGPGVPKERNRAPIPDHETDERAARRLRIAASLAAESGVIPALETHDSHPRGEDVARVLDLLDDQTRESIAVVWDLLHPWRVGEQVEHTWEHLRPWLSEGRGWVQFKDVSSAADPFPLPPGHGVLPVVGAFELLRRVGYTGPLSLEWEKAWHPGAVELEVALEHSRRFFDTTVQ